MHAEPGGERDRAVQLVVVLAHLGDRGAVADHRHDALVVVLERGRRFAIDRGEDALGHRSSCLQGDRTKLRVWMPFGVGPRGSVTDGVHTSEPVDAQVGADADAPADVRQLLEAADLARLESARPHDAAGEDVGAVGEHGAVGLDRGDRCAELELDTLLGQRLGRIRVGLLGERREDDVAMVDERDRRGADVEVVVPLRHHLVNHVGEGSGCFHAGGAGADDHEVKRPLFEAARVEIGVFEQAQDPVAEVLRVERRVQREGVLGRSGNAEEVRLGAHRHDQMIPGERVAVRRGDGSRVDVDRDDLGELDVHRLVLAEETAQRAHHVARGKLGRGDLVQQRLELVVRVLVDQGDRHSGLAEFLGAGDAGEPGADDDDACRASRLSRRHARVRTVPPRQRLRSTRPRCRG